MVVSGPSAAKVSSPKELAGETIAVTRGTTQDRAVTTSTKDVPDVTIVRYEDDSTTATAILTGQQNYLFAASSVLPVIHEKDPTRDLEYKRSEERRVGKECVSTCKCRLSPYH